MLKGWVFEGRGLAFIEGILMFAKSSFVSFSEGDIAFPSSEIIEVDNNEPGDESNQDDREQDPS